jgi:hypothetical protein
MPPISPIVFITHPSNMARMMPAMLQKEHAFYARHAAVSAK